MESQINNSKVVSAHLNWIDAVKGVGILSVLFAHMFGHVFHEDDNYVLLFIASYYMPIFFLASGYVRYKLFYSNEKTPILKYKNYVLLVPFIIIGLAHEFIASGTLDFRAVLESLLFSSRCCGYWFLLVLFAINFAIILTKQVYISKRMIVNLLLPLLVGGYMPDTQ